MDATEVYKVPLVLTPQPEGGYTVTSPVLPELVTEGTTPEEALENVRDALRAVIEAYEDLGRALPANLRQDARSDATQVVNRHAREEKVAHVPASHCHDRILHRMRV